MTDRMAPGRAPRLVHDAPPPGDARGANRRDLIAKVQIARKQLALHEDTYRALLRRVAGVDSSADATVHQLDAVLTELRRLGFKAKRRRPDHRPQVRMIEGLWADLAPFLRLEGDAAGERALQAFVERQTKDAAHPNGVTDHRFLTAKQANKVVEGLKGWLEREQRKAAAAEVAA